MTNTDNITWLNNKKIIQQAIDIDNQKLNNYGTNLIVFYKNKIKSIEKLKESKINEILQFRISNLTKFKK